jgi:hypothetical protein
MAVLLVPVAQAGQLAAACGAVGIAGRVLPTAQIGPAPCLVVLDEPSVSSLAAQRLSRILGRAAVILLRRAGTHLEAERWEGGQLVDTPPAGLLVQGLPDLVSSVLVGGIEPAAVPGAVEIRPGRLTGATGLTGAIRAGAGSGGYLDAERVARRRRLDELSSWVVVAVLALLAVTETARALTADGSWLVVAVAVVVAVLVGLRARRLGRRTAPGASDPSS